MTPQFATPKLNMDSFDPNEEQVQNSDNQNAIGDSTPTTKERTTCIWMAKTLMALSQKELHMQHQLLMAQ
ncbi:unnamed protein product [Pieris brassicae]|uniref:Uncharacterized protein n=1 Tax=Pieris brassicae TaxID=7116 RepID=A0A9P0XJJ8_PIEBR|nr:unnamed protein product [Pieris brassicae]